MQCILNLNETRTFSPLYHSHEMHLLPEVFFGITSLLQDLQHDNTATIGVDHDVDVFVCTHEMQLHN